MTVLYYLDTYPLQAAVVIGVVAVCAERLFFLAREKFSKHKNDPDGAGRDDDVPVSAGKVSGDSNNDQRDAGFHRV